VKHTKLCRTGIRLFPFSGVDKTKEKRKMDKKKLEEFKSQRAKLITDMRTLNSPEMSEEQLASYAKMEADFDAISATIAREEKIFAQESKFMGQIDGKEFLEKGASERGTLDAEQYMEAIGAWMLGGKKAISDKVRSYAATAGIDLNSNEIEVNLLPTREYKRLVPFASSYAQSAQQGSKGGYFVPETMVGMIEIARLEHGSVRQVAEIIRTGSGNPLTWPTVDDTTVEGRLVGENVARTATDIGTIGKTTWGAYTISSDIIKVPFELMEDSVFNVVSLVTDLMGERLAHKEGELFTTGTGVGQPQGIVTGAGAGNTTAGATAITLNELHNLAHTVGTYYRRRGAYMMHPSIIKYVMQLVDGTGQFLWQPSVQLGVPDRFRGYSVYENEEMQSTVTTATKTAIFGELAKYKIRDVGSIRISRLNELYAGNAQIGFVAHTRVDGGILNAGASTANPINYMLQA
jgi:HK97 family phage major capsid protein